MRGQCIAPAAWAWLAHSRAAQLLHLSHRACNLVNERGQVLSLVTEAVGPGPFHVVLGGKRPFTEMLAPPAAVTIGAHGVQVGSLLVLTSAATSWQPQVDWARLRAHTAAWLPTIRHIQKSVCTYRAQIGVDTAVMQPGLESGLACLLAGVKRRHGVTVQAGAARLAGLGPGLTPAGDDILMGAIYGLWATCPQSVARPLVRMMVATAGPRTTTLSAAWLQAAARGEAGSLWHELAECLAVNETGWQKAVAQMLQTGHSSGADALWGFTAVCQASS